MSTEHSIDASSSTAAVPIRRRVRLAVAACILLLAAVAASTVVVPSGAAAVITRLGAPQRVVVEPGLSWKLPAPLERAVVVDRRLRSTATGNHDVLTSDGLILMVQAFAVWQLPAESEQVLHFVGATGNDVDGAANQLRTLLNSALEAVSGRFAMFDLVNTDTDALRLEAYERELAEHLAEEAGRDFGIEIVQVGIERLLLPDATMAATVTRMSEERRVAAEERQAAGRRAAATIRSEAERAARVTRAEAEEEAAGIEAAARAEAAQIYGEAHAVDPTFYVWLRSLETLEQTLSRSTRLILGTDSPPFQALVTPPQGESP